MLALSFQLLAPDPVQRAVARRSVQISTECLLDDECVTSAPYLQENILDDFLGRFPLTHHALRDPDEARVMRAKDGVESALVTSSEPILQLAVGGLVCVGGGVRQGVGDGDGNGEATVAADGAGTASCVSQT